MTALADARRLFPAAVAAPYFATNGYGLMPTTARDALVEAIGRLTDRGVGAHLRLERAIDETRAKVAALIGAQPAEVGFTRNTADGLGFAAEALPWAAGDEIVVFAGEYGTVVYPFLALAERGDRVTVRVVPAAEGRVTPAMVADAIGPRTRAVSLSWVRFDSGYRVDVAAVGTVLRGRGVWFVVDAIQGLGVFPLDVRAAGIDVLAAGCHKWLCAPAGVGVLYVRAELVPQLRPTRAGLSAMVDHESADYAFALRPDVGRVEDGATGELGILALGHSLDVLRDVGLDAVSGQVQAVTDYLCAGFERAGGQVLSPRGDGEWSGIVRLQPPTGVEIDALLSRLYARRIAIGARDGSLWAGAHFYTTVDDADRVLDLL